MRGQLKRVTAECEEFYGVDGDGLGEGEMAFEGEQFTATVQSQGLFLARGGAIANDPGARRIISPPFCGQRQRKPEKERALERV
jgi:hypothetical protein